MLTTSFNTSRTSVIPSPNSSAGTLVATGCPLAADCSVSLDVTGANGVPDGAVAVALNITATQADAPGFLTVYPCGTARPTTSTANYAPGQNVANMAQVRVGSGGHICLYALSKVDVVVDLLGWYGPGATGVGWELGLLGLAGHLGAAGVPAAEDGDAWALSAEGREFAALSGEAWGEAHVAGGGDPAAARASAARTVAFYTGTAEDETPAG